jgi:hypothetical protein
MVGARRGFRLRTHRRLAPPLEAKPHNCLLELGGSASGRLGTLA